MERREQYDPEDIESLLSERSFDELLEEERAYVLRHLTNRDEYETMRKLLQQVRHDEGSEGRIIAPLEVREHVLDVFRQQQQPQWRIWLNSIGAMLWPKEMSGLWRPALALGSLALLITAGVFVFRPADEGHIQLAEVKPAKQPEVEQLKPAPVMEPALDSAHGGIVSGQLEQKDQVPARELRAATYSAADGFAQAVAPAEEAASAERFDATVPGSTTESFDLTTAAPMLETLEEKSLALDDMRKANADTQMTVPHQVTEAEFARNESQANATGRTRETAKRKSEAWKEVPASSRSLGDDAALVSLINSGW